MGDVVAEYRLVVITCPSGEEAERIARTVVEERLAACVNVVPGVTSYYWWEGRVQQDAEWLLLAKTASARLEALTARVRELHSYEVPEVVALPIVGGSPGYLDWIAASLEG
ncbi:MAG: divalent-cation tolerance protein CutA [Anaerolineae bacterium]